MNTERMHVGDFDAKRSGALGGPGAKLALLILIALVPGGLPLALSVYIFQRSKRAAAAAPINRWHATALRAGASVFEKGYRTLGYWDRRP